jgi:hypothetical protein
MDPATNRTSRRALLVLMIAAPLLGCAATPPAPQPVTAPGEANIRAILLDGKGWVLAFTYSLSPAELDRWLQAPSKIEDRAGALVITVNDPSHGRFESDVKLFADGFSYISSAKNNVRLTFDPEDSSVPFKGENNGFTFWFRRKG